MKQLSPQLTQQKGDSIGMSSSLALAMGKLGLVHGNNSKRLGEFIIHEEVNESSENPSPSSNPSFNESQKETYNLKNSKSEDKEQDNKISISISLLSQESSLEMRNDESQNNVPYFGAKTELAQ